MKKPMKTVCFRVPDETWALLDARAKEYGLSHGICAKVLLTECLLGQSGLMEEFRELEERQLRQERHLKTATVAILVDAGKASVEEAQTFVREQLD